MSDVRAVNAGHIEQFIEYQQSLGRAVSTINSCLRAGKTHFNYCLRKGYITANPFEGIQQLKKRHVVGAIFSKQQLKRLLASPDLSTFKGLRDLAIMNTFAHTGIRLTELASLHVQDVSFDGKGVNQHIASKEPIRSPYTSYRPIKERLTRVSYIEERGVLDTDVLFVNVENQPLSARSIQAEIRRYGKITGVSDSVTVSPHAFRRKFCRVKVEAGTNIFVLQRLTGHQSLKILKRYVEIYGRDLEDAIEMGFEGL
ncbi:tyrosine-type recombinase/integrase [Peribacillus loiseleuriae]|uniref:tyrosine-type recombinase/integrase n=1 Tax=Peribacillus loiseleuriae TaxID=1679170 RepID=UPI003CFE428D